MNEQIFKLNMTPRELLFCRDARPMENSWSGSGGFLPNPNTFHGAIVAEYWRKFPEDRQQRFAQRKGGGLRTAGPFLCKGDEIYFPTPLDIVPGEKVLELRKLEGYSDLPAPLEYALFAPKADKKSIAPYISLTNMKNYLNGKEFKLTDESVFFDRESRPGITISPNTKTTVKGQFYYAEYLRLKPEVSLVGEAALDTAGNLEKLFDGEKPSMTLGGQQTVVYLEAQKGHGIPRPDVDISGVFVKWVLLTPAAFLQGWLPDFVDPISGQVKLMANMGEKPEKQPGENRMAYRQRIAKELIDAKLIAARVGKNIAISGWKQKGEGGGAPRAAHLFVPAGSVYYFRAANTKAAALLCHSLNNRAYSAIGGRAGCGIGICGSFTVNDER